jgi:hypothetical protein
LFAAWRQVLLPLPSPQSLVSAADPRRRFTLAALFCFFQKEKDRKKNLPPLAGRKKINSQPETGRLLSLAGRLWAGTAAQRGVRVQEPRVPQPREQREALALQSRQGQLFAV